MRIRNPIHFDRLRHEFSLNEYGIFIFVCTHKFVDLYRQGTFTNVHALVADEMGKLEWYARYTQHVFCNKKYMKVNKYIFIP